MNQSDSGWVNSATDATNALPAVVSAIYAVNASASTIYVMLFDAATVPTNGTVPNIAPIPVPAGGAAYVPFGEVRGDGMTGLSFVNAMVWAASTTAASLTVSTTGQTWLSTRYV